MGQNLILNMDEKGFVVCAYNRTVSKVQDFLNNEAKGTKVIGAESLKDMVEKLKRPRKVMLLVKGKLSVCVCVSVAVILWSEWRALIAPFVCLCVCGSQSKVMHTKIA